MRAARALASIAAAAALSACGGGGSSPPPDPAVGGVVECSRFVAGGFPAGADLAWDAGAGGTALSAGDGSPGGVDGGADGDGGVGIGGALGRFDGALVVVAQADGTPIGEAVVGPDGLVLFSTCGLPGPYLVEIRGRAGARYFDEGLGERGEWVEFGEGESLHAYVASIGTNVGVTPFTEAAYQALRRAGDDAPSAERIREANRRVGGLLNARVGDAFAVDDVTRLPVIVGPDTPAGALTDTPQGRYGTVVAAFAKQAGLYNPGLRAPALQATRQFALDATDGDVDGLDAAGAPVAPVAQRAYDPATLARSLEASVAAVSATFGSPAVRERVPAVIALGAVALPGPQPGGVPTAVELRSDGVLASIDGADAQARTTLDTGVAQLFGASQSPPTALFVKKRDGTVASLGLNGPAGLLADGGTASRGTPARVAALDGATSVALGLSHGVARLPDGRVAAWGDGSRGQLGPALASTRVPRIVEGLEPAVAVAAIADVSFAITGDGGVWSWGAGGPILGAGTAAVATRATPGPVLTDAGVPLRRVLAVATLMAPGRASTAAAAAVDADGAVWTWGDDAGGALGRDAGSGGFAAKVAGIDGRAVALATTYAGFVALDDTGRVWFWGRADGVDGPGPVQPPTAVAGLPTISGLASAAYGLYQARVIDTGGGRWSVEGARAARIAVEPVLDPRLGAAIGLAISPVAGDDQVNAAERAAGVTVTGTVSQPNRPVTVDWGGATRTVTAEGTAWSTTFAEAQVPPAGVAAIVASFTTAAGAAAAPVSRNVTIDTGAPTVAVSVADAADGTATGPVTFTFTWSEPVAGFTAGDVAVGGGTAGALTGSGAAYTMVVTPAPDATGTLTVRVPAGAATDLALNPNAVAATASRAFDAREPDAVPGAPVAKVSDNIEGDPARAPITFTFAWSEPVVGFTLADVDVRIVDGDGGARAPASVGPLFGGGAQYTLRVVPQPQTTGTVTVTVAAGAAADASGVPSEGPVSSTRRFDSRAPYIAGTTRGRDADGDFVDVTWNEPVVDYTSADLVVQSVGADGVATTSGRIVSVVARPPGSGSGPATTFRVRYLPTDAPDGTTRRLLTVDAAVYNAREQVNSRWWFPVP